MTDRTGRPGLLRANAYFLIAGAGLILLGLASPYILRAIRSLGFVPTQMDMMLLLDAVYYLPCLLLPVCVHVFRNNGAGLRLGPVTGGQLVLCMLLAYLCVMLANSLAGLWSMLLKAVGLQLYTVDIEMNSTADLMKAVFAMAVMPGICEELLFRGAVLTAYERGGTRKAIIISSVLFATLHGSLQGLPVQLMIGCVLGCLVCSTGSIYTGMMVHTAYNAFILLISYATRDTAAVDTELVGSMTSLPLAIFWAVEAAVMLLIIWAILKSFAKKGAAAGNVPMPAARLSMDNSAKLVLISGIVTVVYMYLQDILTLMGYQL